jgi:hypothetical protein
VLDVDRIVERVMLRARIPSAARRREIERELRDHLEDMTEEGLDRFGSPDDVGDALARVYAPERLVRQLARSAALVMAASVVAAFIIGSVQIVVGTAATVAQLGSESVGFAAVALGYCASYLTARRFRLPASNAIGLILGGAIWIGAGLSVFAPRHAIIATVAFLSAAFGGLLGYAPVPLLWLAGTAGPLLAFGLALGPLLPGAGRFPWAMWVALSLSCGGLRLIVHIFERYVFTEDA